MQQNIPIHPKISVIIPFYQKEKGILKKATLSALNQKNVSNIEIIIIDDTSPISADEECSDFIKDHNSTIKIIKQENKGPAGARNKGLDSICPDTTYVAFLDSDDEWIPEHLSNAIAALEAGFDFYFSDLYQLGQSTSAFDRAKRITIGDHPKLFANNDVLHEYIGDMQAQIVTGNIIGTSTVVYRFAFAPNLRFREEFIRAGEDYLFWLDLISRENTKISFSSAIEVSYGKGINIYSGIRFGSPEYLEVIYYEKKYRKLVLKQFQLSSTTKAKVKEKIDEQNLNFLKAILSMVYHHHPIDLSLIIKYLKASPEFIIAIPINIIKIIKERF
jgi:succinoglycan biosynthesis protein ExoW